MTISRVFQFLFLGVICTFPFPVISQNTEKPSVEIKEGQRWVFLGDSVTDGFVWPEVLAQSLKQGGYTLPYFINAGIAGDTTEGMLRRFDRDVLSHKPDLLFFQGGGNDFATRNTSQTISNIKAIFEKCRQNNIPVVFLLPYSGHPIIQNQLDAPVRKLAPEYGVTLVDTRKYFVAAKGGENTLLEPDGSHASLAGHKLIARATLDTLGYSELIIPGNIQIISLPGLITEWTILPWDGKSPDPSATALSKLPWKTKGRKIRLPENKAQTNWWAEWERQRGFTMDIGNLFPGSPQVAGRTILTVKEPSTMYLNTGGGLLSVWLDDHQIFSKSENTGWHAGKERIPVKLGKGEHTLYILTEGAFFLSLTMDKYW